MRKSSFLAVIWSALMVCGAPQPAAGQTKSVEAKPGGKLIMQANSGNIEVTTAGVNQVTVKGQGKDQEPDVEITKSGDEIRVRAGFQGGGGSYQVTVPSEFNLDLTTQAGSIRIGDTQGSVRAKTSGGSLHFGRVQGPVWGRTSGGNIGLETGAGAADLKTSGGDVTIGEAQGEVDASTSGGSIRIRRAAKRLSAHTSGGNIDLEEAAGPIEASTSAGNVRAVVHKQPEAVCRLATSGGSVTVELPGKVKLNVDARTSGGRVVTDMPVTATGELKPQALKASINGGGPLLELRTSGGNIYLRGIAGEDVRSTVQYHMDELKRQAATH